MAGKNKYELAAGRRLSVTISVPIEPWVAKALDDMARDARVTRTEMVRAFIMARIDERVGEVASG